jgi:hypothetical protein
MFTLSRLPQVHQKCNRTIIHPPILFFEPLYKNPRRQGNDFYFYEPGSQFLLKGPRAWWPSIPAQSLIRVSVIYLHMRVLRC